MATSPFAFSPATGLRDTSSYPTEPASETAARDQFQQGPDQLRNYINTTLIPAIDGAIPSTQKGAASGVASLDASSKLPTANLPVVPIANGGTGSATQNFVDLSTTQTIGGDKTFAGAVTFSGGVGGSFDSSKTARGYQKLPSGLIIQWGRDTSNTGAAKTFPIAFPTACLAITLGVDNSTVSDTATVDSATTTGFNLRTNPSSAFAYWIAIGY